MVILFGPITRRVQPVLLRNDWITAWRWQIVRVGLARIEVVHILHGAQDDEALLYPST